MSEATILYKPPSYADVYPGNFTLWSYPFRHLNERAKWERYNSAKHWREDQEYLEIPVLENFRLFMDRVQRELEL